ncbi:MAG: HD domain-containing protein, partial [Betaproteobacteria bacterium]|nr:HD domain-containing protein [Betaproteobacteria bacterium]
MQQRRSDYDVTNSVKTTDAATVAAEVRRIYLDLYRKADVTTLDRAFVDFAALYAGEHPGYYPCDTGYHDTQHVLDVTLAMARLLHGYQRAGREPLEARLFCLGVILALYHDCGYIRRRNDTRHENGAEYTLTHVSRGARYLRAYLPQIGMEDLAKVAARVVHFTGYEVPIEKIRLPQPIFRVIGNLLGTADILGQMADRCYLEKC